MKRKALSFWQAEKVINNNTATLRVAEFYPDIRQLLLAFAHRDVIQIIKWMRELRLPTTPEETMAFKLLGEFSIFLKERDNQYLTINTVITWADRGVFPERTRIELIELRSINGPGFKISDEYEFLLGKIKNI